MIRTRHELWFFVVGFVAIFYNADSLMCYQCAGTWEGIPCLVDYKGMVNTSKGISDHYAKNCSDSNPSWDRCVIEMQIGQRNEFILIKRGCHDGKTFTKINDDPKFHNLTPNNYTTCSYVSNRLVCFTFCQDPYCNGPQPVPDSSEEEESQTQCVDYDEVYNNKSFELQDGQSYCGAVSLYANNVVWLLYLSTLIMLCGWDTFY